MELLAPHSATVVAYRGGERWIQTFTPTRLEQPAVETLPLRKAGVYLITGGLGGLGLVLAEYLAKTVQARLVMLSRSAMPPRHEWAEWLATHDVTDSVSSRDSEYSSTGSSGCLSAGFAGRCGGYSAMQQAISRSTPTLVPCMESFTRRGFLMRRPLELFKRLILWPCARPISTKGVWNACFATGFAKLLAGFLCPVLFPGISAWRSGLCGIHCGERIYGCPGPST